MAVHITGTMGLPSGEIYPNCSMYFERQVGVVSQAGYAIVPEKITVTSNGVGAVDFYLLFGNYIGTIQTTLGTIKFAFSVLDVASANFTACIGDVSVPIPADSVQRAENAASAAAASAAAATSSVPPQTFTSVSSLRANATPLDGVTYRLLIGTDQYDYVWVAGSTAIEDILRFTVINSTTASGRYIGVNDVSDTHHVLLMGQSNAVGADPSTNGSGFVANSRVLAWKESTGVYVTPVPGAEPFNVSGCNNVGVQFCNRHAEETGRQQRLKVIADGSTSIAAWTGTPADRTISVGNRPKWVELQTAFSVSGDPASETFIWVQGEADFAMTPAEYAIEFEYMISAMTTAGYISASTSIIVSQLYLGVDRQGDKASSNGFSANMNVYGLKTLADPRIRLASSYGLVAALEIETLSGVFTAGVHFNDASITTLGRQRVWGAYMMARLGIQYPHDIGLEAGRMRGGKTAPQFHRSGASVPASATYTATKGDLGGSIWLNDQAILELPDFTSAAYSSRFRNNGAGLTIYFVPIQTGSVTVRMKTESPAGTGLIQGVGSIYAAGATSIVISAGTNALVNNLYAAIWTGAVWRISRLSA